MESIAQALLVIVLLTNAGEITVDKELMATCPNQVIFATMMEAKKSADEFQDWTGFCVPVQLNYKRIGI